MKQGLTLFLAKSGISVIEDETNGGKKVTLSRTITTDNDIMTWTEGFNHNLILVGFEALNGELFFEKR